MVGRSVVAFGISRWTFRLPAISLCAVPILTGTYRESACLRTFFRPQRDYFGAHTYERVDRPRGEFFHTNWSGHGGKTAAGVYNA